MPELVPVCECCGATWEDRTIDIAFTKGGEEAEMLCHFCKGLIEAGMLRPEVVRGRRRYRQWHFEWKPGELLPAAGS